MKRFAMILFALILMGLTACSDSPQTQATPAAQDTAAASQPTAAAAPTPGFTAADVCFALDGQVFAPKSDVAPLLEALGDGYQYEEADSCVYEGYDKTFKYGDLIVYTNPDGDIDFINEITLVTGRYATARGIAVGSSREDVEAAYGTGYVDDGSCITYIESGDPDDLASNRLIITLDESGTVISIDYYYPTNITE